MSSTCSGILIFSHCLNSYLFLLVADITGFTAWCSEREPSQVFLLLESIYGEYDAIAKKRKVFKVETIGDCYMAVAGLPEPRDDHALVVCRFARECLNKLRVLLNDLEVTLGPGKNSGCGLDAEFDLFSFYVSFLSALSRDGGLVNAVWYTFWTCDGGGAPQPKCSISVVW